MPRIVRVELLALVGSEGGLAEAVMSFFNRLQDACAI